MDDLEIARANLDRRLGAALAEDPLRALDAIGEIGRDLAVRQGEAVRAAVQDHTWSEIGAALGVSKQAAHQRFAKEWAQKLKDEIKAEQRAFKAALRDDAAGEAAAAAARRDALVAEFKNANRRRKQGRAS